MKPHLVIVALALVGCASPKVVPAGPDTYSISIGGGMRFPRSSSGLRERAFQTASDFCAARGLVMVPVSVDQKPPMIGRSTASIDLVFRALPPGDPDIRRPDIESPDVKVRIERR